MNRRGSGAWLVGALIALALIMGGCAKRVPLPNGNFEAPQHVVLTLKDGSTISGHIDPGARVEYRNGASIYRARVTDVTRDSLSLGEIVLVDRTDSYATVSTRLASARVVTEPPIPAVNVARTDISKVDLVKFDGGKTLRRTLFWAYTGALFVLLLGSRS